MSDLQQTANMPSNPFENYSDAAKPVWSERQERATAKRQNTIRSAAAARFEKDQEEQDKLLRRFKASERAEEQRLLDGPHGKDVAGLKLFLRTMTPESAPALVKLMERATWISAMSFTEKTALTMMVSRAIVRLRKKSGLTSFDDPMPFTDEPPSAYDLVKAEIWTDGELRRSAAA